MNENTKYYIHRVSNGGKIAEELMDEGYLSIGWSSLSADEGILNPQNNVNRECFKEYLKGKEESRSLWHLWRFVNFKKGDIIVVPLYRAFQVFEVIGMPMSVNAVTKIKSKVENENADIGFIIEVKPLTERKERNRANSILQSKMKFRGTNLELSKDIKNIKESVEEAIKSEAAINIHDKLVDKIIDDFSDVFYTYVTDRNLEIIVKNYMEKKGADKVQTPPKNEDKIPGSDADVIAEFYDLGLVYYIQVKKHEGDTNDWAVEQISKYVKDDEEDSDLTYIRWAVSTGNKFNEAAIKLAKEKKVRLIDKDEFYKMLLDIGLYGIDKLN